MKPIKAVRKKPSSKTPPVQQIEIRPLSEDALARVIENLYARLNIAILTANHADAQCESDMLRAMGTLALKGNSKVPGYEFKEVSMSKLLVDVVRSFEGPVGRRELIEALSRELDLTSKDAIHLITSGVEDGVITMSENCDIEIKDRSL